MRRGFTLIELLITMTIATLILAPILATVVMTRKEFSILARELDLKTESQLLACRVVRPAAAGRGYRLGPDNHELTFPGGETVRWKDQQVWLEPGHRALSDQPVTEFAVVRVDGRLVLTLALGGRRSEYRWSVAEGFR